MNQIIFYFGYDNIYTQMNDSVIYISWICLFTYSNFSYPGNFESFPTIVARKLASW